MPEMVEYVADITFKEANAKFVVKGEEYTAEGYKERITVVIPDFYSQSKWENAMYDTLLDGLKGTDMSKIANIDIGSFYE
jgi:hypothetical protein